MNFVCGSLLAQTPPHFLHLLFYEVTHVVIVACQPSPVLLHGCSYTFWHFHPLHPLTFEMNTCILLCKFYIISAGHVT